jgi:hypothetical protein
MARSRPVNKDMRFLIITLVTVIIASILGSVVQSSGGEVRVNEIRIPTQNGQWVAGDLFKPRKVSKDNPARLRRYLDRPLCARALQFFDEQAGCTSTCCLPWCR